MSTQLQGGTYTTVEVDQPEESLQLADFLKWRKVLDRCDKLVQQNEQIHSPCGREFDKVEAAEVQCISPYWFWSTEKNCGDDAATPVSWFHGTWYPFTQGLQQRRATVAEGAIGFFCVTPAGTTSCPGGSVIRQEIIAQNC